MAHRSPLDDPKVAAHAWARYRRLMWWMFGFTGAVVIVALTLLYIQLGMASAHLYVATALGVGFAMLLMSALMGLVFLSSGTGHDESISDAGREDQAAGGSGGRKR
jgi:NhaP-type Na+/H+ or K+/H+ antiporter